MKIKFSILLLIILASSCKESGKERNPVNSSPRGQDKNIYLKSLRLCGLKPMTGFLRNGYCQTNNKDEGVHTVCALITEEFLKYALRNGNDLITEKTKGFPGLKPGDRWCICADWWKAAAAAGYAPLVDLQATHRKTLLYIDLEALESFDANQKSK